MNNEYTRVEHVNDYDLCVVTRDGTAFLIRNYFSNSKELADIYSELLDRKIQSND